MSNIQALIKQYARSKSNDVMQEIIQEPPKNAFARLSKNTSPAKKSGSTSLKVPSPAESLCSATSSAAVLNR